MYKRNQNGFSVIEIAIVVVCLAVLAGVGVVAFNALSKKPSSSQAPASTQASVPLDEFVVDFYRSYNAAKSANDDAQVAAVFEEYGTTHAQSTFAADEKACGVTSVPVDVTYESSKVRDGKDDVSVKYHFAGEIHGEYGVTAIKNGASYLIDGFVCP